MHGDVVVMLVVRSIYVHAMKAHTPVYTLKITVSYILDVAILQYLIAEGFKWAITTKSHQSIK